MLDGLVLFYRRCTCRHEQRGSRYKTPGACWYIGYFESAQSCKYVTPVLLRIEEIERLLERISFKD